MSHSIPGGSDGKESTCSVRDPGSIPGLGRCPGGGCGNPLQHSCQENPLGQRSLAGYSPWGPRELDTTERLSTYFHGATKMQRIMLMLAKWGHDGFLGHLLSCAFTSGKHCSWQSHFSCKPGRSKLLLLLVLYNGRAKDLTELLNSWPI